MTVGQPTVTVKLDNGTGTFPTDVSAFVSYQGGATVEVSDRGRTDEFDQPGSSQLKLVFDNADGRFTNGTVVLVPDQTLIRFTETFGATTLDRFTGRVSALDLKWPSGGQEFATVQVTAVDVLADLGRTVLLSMLAYETLTDSPAAYYTLGEAAGATAAGDTSGNSGPTLGIAGSGKAPAFGDTNSPVDSTACAFSGGRYLLNNAGSFFSFTIECFISTTDTNGGIVMVDDPVGGSYIRLVMSGGAIQGVMNGPGSLVPVSASGFNDGNLHHVALTINPIGGTLSLYVDGVLQDTSSGSTLPTSSLPRIRIGYDGSSSLAGSVSQVALYASALSTARIAVHAQIGLATFQEATDARLSRLASYLGLTATTTSPSDQIMGPQSIAGTSMYEALQKVAEAEGGVLLADGSGNLVMQGRYYRALRTAADLTLDADAIDPGTVVTWDTQQKFNQVLVTRTGGAEQIVATAAVIAHTATVYPKSLELDVDTDQSALDAANWILAKYQTTTPRLGSVTFDLGTSTHAEALLGLDIGDRLSLTPMPSQLWSGVGDYTVEGLTETVTDDEWTLTVNLLPWQLQQAWVLGDPTYSVLGSTTVLGY